MAIPAARDLSPLFSPSSIALVGASDDPMKWGGWLAGCLIAQPGHPPVHFVARRPQVRGREAFASIGDLPERPDLVVLAIPAPGIPAAVDEALAAGAKALIVITAGFGEAGAEGRRIQSELVAKARRAGAVLLGPNCLGAYDPSGGLNAAATHDLAPGPIAFCGQSGNLALEVGMKLIAEGLGYSRFASTGNQADISVTDVLASVIDHEESEVAACYVEDPGDGRAFLETLARVSERKPVLVMQAGRSAAGAAAAASHTGALAGSSRVFAAAVREAGGIPVATPGALVDAALALLGGRRLAGRRIAVLADGGGHGVTATDLLAEAGFETPPLSAATAAQVQPHLPNSEAQNPVDLAGAGEQDINSFAGVAAGLLSGDEVDGVLFSGFFGGYSGYSDEALKLEVDVARRIAAAAAQAGKPVVVHSMLDRAKAPAHATLRAGGVPTYMRVEDAIRALTALSVREPAPRPEPGAVPQSPIPERPAYDDARALLAEIGIEFPAGALARTDAEAGAIAARLGGRIALKGVSADLLHKSDAGGVALGLEGAEAVAAASAELRERVRIAVGLELDGVFVETMAAAGGVDLVIGARRDPQFGPVVLIGVGGIFVEVLDDVVVALAPADPGYLERLVRGLRAWPLLAGARGAEPVDVAAVCRAAAALGDLLVGRPELSEVEINPARATGLGLIALDARIVAG